MKVYFDNASTTPLTPTVADVMHTALKETYGNPSSIHEMGRRSRAAIEGARKKIASIIEASVGEVFFTSSATEANNMVLRRSILDLGIKRIISCETEHHCILHTLNSIKNEYTGVDVILLPVDRRGHINYKNLEDLLTIQVPTLVSLMMVNNEIGTMHDVKYISELCVAHGVLFHCDAVQGIAKYPMSVRDTYYSFMTSSAHKYHGPKGIGFLYMNNNHILKPLIYGGAQERNMRAGTENLYGILGMAQALSEAVEEMEARQAHILALRSHFILRLKNELKDVRINGDEDKGGFHIISVSFPPSEKAGLLIFNLDISGIAASSGSACSSGIETDSHVMVAINHPSERKSIRFSFSHYNTITEVDYVIEQLKRITPTQ